LTCISGFLRALHANYIWLHYVSSARSDLIPRGQVCTWEHYQKGNFHKMINSSHHKSSLSAFVLPGRNGMEDDIKVFDRSA